MFLDTRDAIVSYIKAQLDVDFPSLAVAWPNLAFDWNNPPPEFIAVEINLYSGSQVNVESSPRSRIRGVLEITHYVREGLGTRQAAAFLDWAALALAYRKLGPANLQAPTPDGPDPVRGYSTTTIGFPFYTDPA